MHTPPPPKKKVKVADAVEQATLLWLARLDLGAVLWTANADLILHRIQHLGGAATRDRSRQRHAQHRFFRPAGDPAAATWAHRNATRAVAPNYKDIGI